MNMGDNVVFNAAEKLTSLTCFDILDGIVVEVTLTEDILPSEILHSAPSVGVTITPRKHLRWIIRT
jgi:hypothetical protein